MNVNFYLLCVSLILSGCTKIQDFTSIYGDNLVADYGTGIEIDYYLHGKLDFQLIAPEIEQISDPVEQNIFSQGIKVFIYNDALDTIASIYSDFAIQNKKEKLVEVKKNVILQNNKDEQLSTETLFWDRDTKTIYTDDFVTIKTDNEIIMGYGFITDQTFSTYSLSNITGTIYL